MTKARLYFNAKSYIGKEMYAEAAQICQDILDGKYGAYELDADWTTTFGFSNEFSHEIIWSFLPRTPRRRRMAAIGHGRCLTTIRTTWVDWKVPV